MNNLTERQQQVLSRGLASFDAATRARRIRRSAALAVSAVAVLAIATVVGVRLLQPPPSLPAYVEIIRDDPQLSSELALANACERFERSQGRFTVVECSVRR